MKPKLILYWAICICALPLAIVLVLYTVAKTMKQLAVDWLKGLFTVKMPKPSLDT